LYARGFVTSGCFRLCRCCCCAWFDIRVYAD